MSMREVFLLVHARAVVRDGELLVRVRTTPNGSYIVLTPDEWWRKLAGIEDPPCIFQRFRRRALSRKASVVT